MADIKFKIEIQTDILDIAYTDYTDYLILPICSQQKLDESLDLASIRLANTNVATVFEPQLRVRITYTQTGSTKPRQEVWLIAQDNITHNIGADTYTHDISLIECSKILERIVCDTKTFTQPLLDAEGYAKLQTSKAPYIVLQNNSLLDITNMCNINAVPYTSPVLLNTDGTATITVSNPRMYGVQDGLISRYSVRAYDWADGKEYFTYTHLATSSAPDVFGEFSVTGTRTIRLETTLEIGSTATKAKFAFDVTTMVAPPNHEKYSIYDVIQIVLQVCETIRLDELQSIGTRIQLAEINSGEQYVYTSKLKSITAPEFAFGKMTLWEVFTAIGGKLNAIPLLVANATNLGYTLYFKRLDMTELTPPIRNAQYYVVDSTYSETCTQSVEQFCNKLDSDVDNLIDTDKPNTPSIIEPAVGYYKTPRVETGIVVVNETEVKIATQYPIERLISVECGYLPDNSTIVGDITNYIYESAEYGSLSSYTTAFPCKALALYYTYGQKDIKGLTFKPDIAWVNAFGLGLFNYYTILRIISLVTGKQLNALEQLFTSNYDLRFLTFRVKYIPRISARVKVSKTVLEDNKNESTLTYTQGANLVSATYYGEALKGIISRYGNVDKNVVQNMIWLDDIADDGQVYRNDHDYKVSAMNLEVFPDHIKQELALSKHFNRYSQYVGADNYLRLFEVSERQAIERKTVYEEYIVFSYSDNEPASTTSRSSIITTTGFEQLMKGLFVNGYNCAKIDKINFRGYSKEDVPVQNWISLPAITMGVGNTMYIGTSCADNYSAGDKVVAQYSDSKYFDAQQYVPYCDYYGEIYSLEFEVGYCDSTFATPEQTFVANWAIGNSIPDRYLNSTANFIATGTKRLLLLKDSREIMELSAQIHFVSDRDSGIIIGGAVADNNGLMELNTSNVAVYVLPDKLGEFADYIDVGNRAPIAVIQSNLVIVQSGASGAKCTLPTITSTQSGVCWAVINRDTGRLIIGKNEQVRVGDFIDLPKAYVVRGYNKNYK